LKTPVHDFLVKSRGLSCHTPGHKGTLHPLDLTEIDGAVETIQLSERFAADLFGAGRTLFSCSGSTLGIFAMSAPFAGKSIAIGGSVHRSIVDAAILLDIMLSADTDTADALLITSIDYYGNFTLNPSIEIPLLVDNAHGAYLVFTEEHPLHNGAVMTVESAHKTLPALTGAAYLHISAAQCDKYAETVTDAMALFGTTSPSFLILDSLDLCNRHIALERERALSAFDAVATLKDDLINSGFALRKTDRLRITVNANDYGYSGAALADELSQHGIVSEMHDNKYVILMFSTITTHKDCEYVSEAFRKVSRKSPIIGGTDFAEYRNKSPAPLTMRPRTAYFSPKRTVKTREAIGHICAGVHVTIPPCVPLVLPGELITAEKAELLSLCGLDKITVLA
jgi:arginine/lysine/ornithine decarboxylase